MNLLAERAREGALSAEEEAELDSYLHVGNLLTIVQSKSRVYVRTHEGTPSPQLIRRSFSKSELARRIDVSIAGFHFRATGFRTRLITSLRDSTAEVQKPITWPFVASTVTATRVPILRGVTPKPAMSCGSITLAGMSGASTFSSMARSSSDSQQSAESRFGCWR